MGDVCQRLVGFFFDELISKVEKDGFGQIGFAVAGYSAGARHAELWELSIQDPAERPAPVRRWEGLNCGWTVFAQPEAVARLLNGYDPVLNEVVKEKISDPERSELLAHLAALGRPAVNPAMPFADAIDFARFCVDTTIGYTRFLPGADLVGGPVDVAGISRHEGFKWIQRKHYYPQDLNPRRPHDHDQ